jgi:excisionase family DNA binding protein
MNKKPKPDIPRYLTVEEVADQFRVSRMTVYRMAKSGELPAVRFGRSYRISEQELNAYIARSMEPPSENQ